MSEPTLKVTELHPDTEIALPEATDPQVAAILRAASARPSMSPQRGLAEFRRAAAGLVELGGSPPSIGDVKSGVVPGEGGPIPVRTFHPARPQGADPVLVFAHGGSFVRGDLDTHDTLCRHLVGGSGCAVLSVDYRLAPEQKYPAAIQDLESVLAWIERHGHQSGLDPKRVGVGGDSSGANLAAVTAHRARNRTPPLCVQLLLNPVTDLTASSGSHVTYADRYLVARDTMMWCIAQYTPADMARSDPELSPLLAADLSGLAPAVIVTAELDPLREDGERYAARLEAAGVPTQLTTASGMIHNFLLMTGVIDRARIVLRDVGAQLREALTCQ